MLLEELLNEALRELPAGFKIEDVEKTAKLLQKNCSQMIKVYQETGGKIIYRGMKRRVKPEHRKNNSTHLFATVRKDRRPVDVSIDQHEQLEKWFKELGLKANRRNSIFCTTSRDIADGWGEDVKIIFMRDGWEGTAFEEVKEDYAYHTLAYADNIEEIKNLKPFKVTPANLADVIDEGYEDLIITGPSYFAFSDEQSMAFISRLFKALDIPTTHL